jgi:hypothetical protein
MVQSYIGAPIRRREDVRFLTGTSKFVVTSKCQMLHGDLANILRPCTNQVDPYGQAAILALSTC